jgi:photosystem II stability/assembly factor-like uncharacterized protein
MTQFLRIIFLNLFLIVSFEMHSQWTPVNVGTTNDVYAVDYLDPSNIFMVGDDGLIKSTNGGVSWTTYPLIDNFSNPILGSLFYDIHFFDPNNGVASGFIATGNSEVIYKTSNGGLNWTMMNVNNVGGWPRMINDFGFYSPLIGVAVGTNGRILRTTNSGNTWVPITSGVSNSLNGVNFATSSIGIIVGDQVILRTTNGGASWAVNSTPSYNLKNIHFVNSNLGYAIGNGILKTTNAGVTWNLISPLNGDDVYGIDADSAFICNTGVYKTSNVGSFWGAQASVSAGTYNDLDFLNLTDGYVVGNNGMVYKTTTGGEPVPQTDASVNLVEPYSATICPGMLPVKVKLKNYGINTISTATINWSVDGIYQGSSAWTGTLLSDSITSDITIGSYNFNYISQKVKAWVSNPNNVNDQFKGNDSASTVFQTSRLNGNYTIGGISPDFATFTSAVTAINNYGICGNVVFKIRNGSYTGSVSINPYTTASPNDSIIFESELLDSSLVNLSSTAGPTVLFNGSKRITFYKLTVSSTGTKVFEFKNGADKNRLHNCVIIGNSSDAAIGYSGSTSNGVSLMNNSIQNGLYGIYLSGNTSSYAKNYIIYNNNFINQTSKGIYLVYSDSAIVSNNSITSTVTSSFEGINFSNGKGFYEIEKNKIYTSTGTGLYINGCNNTIVGLYGRVTNNFVRTGLVSGNLGTAVLMASSYQVEIVNNTFYCLGTNGINCAFGMSYPDTNSFVKLKLVNNILVSNGGGLPVRIVNSNSSVLPGYYRKLFEVIGPNCYKNNSTNCMLLPNFTCANFTDWKNKITQDTLSFILDPQFASPNNLHLYLNGGNYALENGGRPWTSLVNDIDNDLRPVNPDIGADEVVKPLLDIQLLSFSDTTKICNGNNSPLVNVINHGSSTITSLIVNWSVNNVLQSPYNWSGTLLSGDTSNYFSIGSYNFASGNYTIQAWVSSPNSGVDAITINDSLKMKVSAGGLSGNYVIGLAPSNYTTIASAVNDLILNGICGPVIFDIKSGIYNEQVTIPPIGGSSLYNTITFRSLSGDSTTVDWNFAATSANNYVLRLNGADNIRVERVTIRSSVNTYNTAIKVSSGCDNFVLEACRIIGRPSGSGYVVTFDNTSDNHILIKGNYFYSGSTGIMMQSTLSSYESDNKIINNLFFNVRNIVINASYQSHLIIDGNTILSDTITTGVPTAITVSWTKLPLVVSNNNINARMRSGIDLSNHVGGIYSRALINNNMVLINGSQCLNGIQTQLNAYYVDLIHNTIQLDNTTASFNGALRIFSPNTRVHNNIVSNLGSGPAFDLQTSTLPSCDNNLYEASSPTLITKGTAYTSLASWTTATSWDKNSLQGNPGFISNSNLHITPGSIANNKASGAFTSYISTDIDKDPRLYIPDIGADEFSSVPSVFLGNDTSLCTGQVLNAGNAGSSYLWNTGATTQTIAVTNSGTYWVKVTNYLGTDNDTINLLVSTSPSISITGSGTICNGGSSVLTVSGASSYSWSTGATSASINVTPTVTTTYSVVGTATNSCTAFTIQTVTVNPSPTISVVASSTDICVGQTATLTANGANTYTWSTSATTSSINVNPVVSTIFTVSGTNSVNCQNTKTISISVATIPTVNISASSVLLCSGQSSTLTSSGALNYTLYPGGTLGATQTVTPASSVIYTVTGGNSLNCKDTETLSITVNPNPTVSVATSGTLICVGQSATLSAAGASSYTWNTSSASASIVVTPSITTTYSVTGTSSGCTNFCSFTQSVSLCTGIEGFDPINYFVSVFPNPNNGQFVILSSIDMDLIMINELGQTIKTFQLNGANNHRQKINDLCSGMYFIISREGGKLVKEKIIVSN